MPVLRDAGREVRGVMILPEAFPASCPQCAGPKIKPIYVHDEIRDEAGCVIGGCAHYVCVACSKRHGPGGRWRVRVDATGQPARTAA